jgi:hypothetical protein
MRTHNKSVPAKTSNQITFVTVQKEYRSSPTHLVAAIYQQLCLIPNTSQLQRKWLNMCAPIVEAQEVIPGDRLWSITVIRARLGIVLKE